MARSISNQNMEDHFKDQSNPSRGARVFGMPMCIELADYLDETSNYAVRERFVNMLFAGMLSSMDVEDLCFEDDGF